MCSGVTSRDASPCSGCFGMKQVTRTSGGGVGGGQRAGHVLVTVEQRGPADRRAGENPFYTSAKIRQINERDLHAGTRTHW